MSTPTGAHVFEHANAVLPGALGRGESLVNGRPVDGCDSAIPVTAGSRVVLHRRQGPMLDVLNRGVVRRICLN